MLLLITNHYDYADDSDNVNDDDEEDEDDEDHEKCDDDADEEEDEDMMKKKMMIMQAVGTVGRRRRSSRRRGGGRGEVQEGWEEAAPAGCYPSGQLLFATVVIVGSCRNSRRTRRHKGGAASLKPCPQLTELQVFKAELRMHRWGILLHVPRLRLALAACAGGAAHPLLLRGAK